MNILCKLEGGLGDCFIGNKFIHAVKEIYPDADYTIAFETESNFYQENCMKSLWPTLYKNTFTLGKRLNSSYVTKNKHGMSIFYPQAIENLADNFKDTIKKYDKYYDFHVSSLNFMGYEDIDWLKWYSFFPRPEVNVSYNGNLPDKFILVHLYPRKSAETSLDRDYGLELIKSLKNVLPVVAICNKEDADWYDGTPDLLLYDLSITDIFYIASKCSVCYAADSSIRFIPLHYGKPTFVFSRWCDKANSVKDLKVAHSFRWLLLRQTILPIRHDINKVIKLTKNLLKNPAYNIYPEFSDGLEVAIQDFYRL
jgi:hypothetical protein